MLAMSDGPQITVTGTAQFDAWASKVIPPVEQVRPGLWSVPVPMPDNPLRYVVVYLFELAGGGLGMVDTGWNTDEAWEALNAGLATAGGSINDVQGVLVTHIHPDHYGLAGRVREASGAWIGLHPADAALVEDRYLDTETLVNRMVDLLSTAGVPEDRRPDLANASMDIRRFVDVAVPDRLVEDADRIDFPGWQLEAVWTPGHSPGHLCLLEPERRILLGGDHVLPRISPIVTVHSQQFPNPLGDFLASLQKVARLDVDEVLPAHEYRFAGLAERAAQLAQHHAERLDEVAAAVEANPGSTCWEITLAVSWSRPFDEIPVYMQRAANGETLAHLVVLELEGRVLREAGQPARFLPATP